MKKEVRNQTEEFIKYNIELRRLSEENFADKQAKDMSAATDNGQFDDYTNKWYFYEATFEVTNSVKFIMPTTGANGVWRFIFFGFGTMAVLTTGLVVYDARNKRTRKRRRK